MLRVKYKPVSEIRILYSVKKIRNVLTVETVWIDFMPEFPDYFSLCRDGIEGQANVVVVREGFIERGLCVCVCVAKI